MSLLRPIKGRVPISRLKPFLEDHILSLHPVFVLNGSRAHLCAVAGKVDFSKWRKLDSRKLGIKRSLISMSSWIVLKKLQTAGFEAYLVGGCVRDFLLNKVPKDFDVITTAKLGQVKKEFHRAIIVGSRFPICRVPVKGSVVEVSSFETVTAESRNKQVSISKIPAGCDLKDFIRWNDCMHRDFTINSLFYDPFVNTIFDYTDAMTDLKSLRLRTVIPARVSFKSDQARILRGLRLAARLNLSFSKETEAAIERFSSLVMSLSTSRISLEMNYMLSYGAAEPSFILLKRFKLLELLLPFNAAYLSQQSESGQCLRSSMLMKLFFNLDQLITCDQPCDECLWIAILVFHTTLFNNPQNFQVVLTIAAIFYRGTWEGSIKFAREHTSPAKVYVPEMLNDFGFLSDGEISERIAHFFSQVKDSINVFISKDCLLKSVARFPEFPCSGYVLVSQKMGRRVEEVFSILRKGNKSLNAKKDDGNVDSSLLRAENKRHIRSELGKIVMNTLVCGSTEKVARVRNDDIQITHPPPKVKALEQTACQNKYTQSMSRSDDKSLPASKATLLQESSVFANDRWKMIIPTQPGMAVDNHHDDGQLLENVNSRSMKDEEAVTMRKTVNSETLQGSSENHCKIMKEWQDEVMKRQDTPKEENMLLETTESDGFDSHYPDRSLVMIGKEKNSKTEPPRSVWTSLSGLFK